MNILLTGATGGIGKKILDNLIKNKNIKVFVLSRSLRKESVGEGYETCVGDILDEESLKKVCKNVDIVIHAAGLTHSMSKAKYFQVNLEGTKNLLKACKSCNVKQFIFLSSRTASEKGGAYAKSKLMAEEEVRCSKLNYVILSLAEVFGTDTNEAISSLIAQVGNNKIIFIPGDGSYNLCPVSVHDVVRVVGRAIEPDIKNKEYLIAGQESFSYDELVDFLAKKMNKKVRKFYIPIFILRLVSFVFPQFLVQDQIDRLLVEKSDDISKAKLDLGFNPEKIEQFLK